MSSNYDKYLHLTMDKDDITDEWEYYGNNNCCFFCELEFDKIYKQYVAFLYELEKKTKTCFLCYIVVNFKRYHIGSAILVKSKLNQRTINTKTLEYFQKFKSIPIPTDLDKTSLIIEMQCFEFANMQDFSVKEKIFDDYRVFFTGNAEKGLIIYKRPQKNLFVDTSPDKKKIPFDTKYFDIPKYVFSSDDIYIISKLRNKLKDNNNKHCFSIKHSLKNKHITVKKNIHQYKKLQEFIKKQI
jgi:hypothetical protein